MNNAIQLSLQQATKLIDSNRLDEARNTLLKIDKSSPNNIQVYHLMSVIFGMSADYEQCELYCKKALSINKNAVVILNNMGSAQKLQGKYDEARKSFQNAINIQKDYIDAYVNLANLLLETERIDEAENIITSALKIDNRNPAINMALGNLYLKQDLSTEAISIYENILLAQPTNTDCIINLGQIYEHLGDNDTALKYYSRALETIPNYEQSIIGITSILEKQGKYEEALRIISTAAQSSSNIKLHIIHGRIHSRLKNYAEAESILLQAKDLIAIDQYKQELLYELGDARDKLTHYSDAFSAYFDANQINKTEFDRERSVTDFTNLKHNYTRKTLAHLATSGNKSTQPVFIIGMPRSGTSLIEQILASHSKVFGGGELEYIDEAIQALESRIPGLRYPENASILDHQALQQSAEEYIVKLSDLSADSAYITNKMPHNFLHLGLIQQLFPNAKVIHCIRDERDTALSIYFHQFNTNHPYANDLSNLHFYYQQYKDLMEHWNRELSLDIYTVKYENMVTTPEKECRQLIDFIGLDWEDDCLNFHNSSRLVNTPSYYQVKQPLYKSAINRHMNYIDQLDEFS